MFHQVMAMVAVTWIVPSLVFFITIFGWQHFVGIRTVAVGMCYVQYMEEALFNCLLQVCVSLSVCLSLCLSVCMSSWLSNEPHSPSLSSAYLRSEHTNTYHCGLATGVVVSALASINEVNQRRARLVLRRVTVSGFNSRCRTLILVCNVTNQPLTANSAFHPSGVGKWVPASAGKAKAGRPMVHSVSGWTRGVQVKLWDPLRTRARPERLRGVITTRRYTNPRLSYCSAFDEHW